VKDYYSIPFDAQALIDKQKHSLCELSESIQMNIHLIMRTHLKECRYDHTYGCMIWNKDYSTVTNVSQWKDELKELMLTSIEKNETRIGNVKVKLNMEDAEFSEQLKKHPIKLKKRITIQITGVITSLNEPFDHFEHLFFSPLSIG
jgi:predicted component of type VI protein secretion system